MGHIAGDWQNVGYYCWGNGALLSVNRTLTTSAITGCARRLLVVQRGFCACVSARVCVCVCACKSSKWRPVATTGLLRQEEWIFERLIRSSSTLLTQATLITIQVQHTPFKSIYRLSLASVRLSVFFFFYMLYIRTFKYSATPAAAIFSQWRDLAGVLSYPSRAIIINKKKFVFYRFLIIFALLYAYIKCDYYCRRRTHTRIVASEVENV